MTKNSIGHFLAALRKANGMTQQEVADRLNVSNKAVSRWERDECAPDISVIPALAELFGVTCDELLKGERILESSSTDKNIPKVEKQVKTLILKTLSGFKTLIWISLAISIIGLVCMFGISYGFYRPVIGFAVMLLFEVCSLALSVLAVSRTRDVKDGNELFSMADDALIATFNRTCATLSFSAYFLIFSSVLLSVPLLLNFDSFTNSVLTIRSYLSYFFFGIVLILIFVWLKCKRLYTAWITGAVYEKPKKADTQRAMTIVQLSLTAFAGMIFLFAPYFDKPNAGFTWFDAFIIVALLCYLISIVYFIIILKTNKALRKTLWLPGIRNLLTMLPLPLLQRAHYVSWCYVNEDIVGNFQASLIQYKPYDTWNIEYIWYTAAISLIIFMLFSVIDFIMKNPSPPKMDPQNEGRGEGQNELEIN